MTGFELFQQRLLFAPRVATSFIRALPDFIIIGAAKCGTTSLYDYMVQHPCIAPAQKKEVLFFDRQFRKGLGWYKAHFPSRLYQYGMRKIFRKKVITGEASPSYLFYPFVPKRILEIVPQVKLIVLLRNPIDRAFSQYRHKVRDRAFEKLSFPEAIDKEPERLAGEAEKIAKDSDYVSHQYRYYSYLARGIYVDQLKFWMNFFPRERFLILKSEDLFARPDVVVQDVFRFLGVPDFHLPNYKVSNEGQGDLMLPQTRERLRNYFAPHNRRLYEFLGKDFGWEA